MALTLYPSVFFALDNIPIVQMTVCRQNIPVHHISPHLSLDYIKFCH